MTTQKTNQLPNEIPLLPLRSGVLLPGSSLSMPVGRRRSVTLVERVEPGTIVGVAVQRDPDIDEPGLIDLHDIGTYARVTRVQRVREGNTYRVLLEGIGRFQLDELLQSEPYIQARVTAKPDVLGDEAEAMVLA
jgi:ATP-dependent Lon protease